MSKNSNPDRFQGSRDSIAMLGKVKKETNNLTPEEIAENEEHNRQMKALYADRPEDEEEG